MNLIANNISRGVLVILLIVPSLPLKAQWDQFQYQRSLSGIEDTWHRIDLPNEIFSKLKPDYADIRIMGINAKGDTIEAPYVLEHPIVNPVVEQSPFKLLNQSRKGGLFYITLESPKQQEINRIHLNLGDQNFDWEVQLEGSQDQQEWFSLLKDYRILSVANGHSDYSFTTLHFPNAQYRYYRLIFPSKKRCV